MESNDKIVLPEKMCRVCLKESGLREHSIFSEINSDETITISEFLMSISNLEISHDDDFPKTICTHCFRTTKLTYEFLLKCNGSQEYFETFSSTTNHPEENVDKISDDDIIYEAEISVSNEETFIDEPEENVQTETEERTDDKMLPEDSLTTNPKVRRNIDFADKCTEKIDPDSGGTFFVCKWCQAEMTNFSSFKDHYENHLDPIYLCYICKKMFKLGKNLARHLRIHRVQSKSKHLCQVCGKSFRSPSGLKAHGDTHLSENMPYECKICNKKFRSSSGRIKHDFIFHNDKRPYLCFHCGKSFPFNGHLTRHITSVHGEKDYKCNICDKAYTSALSLKLHMHVHSEIKAFICADCGKGFKRQSNLRTHMNSHGEKKYECGNCHKRFTQRASVRTHQKICRVPQ